MEEKEPLSPEQTPETEEKTKSMLQLQKESWYDKVPLTVKQLDWIIIVCFILLALTAVVIYLDAKDIFNPFGY